MEQESLISALYGHNESNGGLDILDLRSRLLELFPEDQEINQSSRFELRKKYLDRIPLPRDKIRLLVLCGNNNTATLRKSEKRIRRLFNIDDSEEIEIFYINDNEVELTKGDRAYIASVSDINDDLFFDNYFNYVFDENCPFNSDIPVLTKDTFRWVWRILKRGGVFIISDFSDIYRNNAKLFYYTIRYALPTLKTLDKLLNFINDNYGKKLAEKLLSESEDEEIDQYDYVFEKFLDHLVEIHYEEYLEKPQRIFKINGEIIKDIDELERVLDIQFDINTHIDEGDLYLFLTKKNRITKK